MAKKKTPSPPPSGNAFDYYIPTPGKGGAKLSTTKPTPVPTASSAGGKPKYVKPRKFIKDHFMLARAAPFGTKGALGGNHIVIQDIQIVRAALECGYGRRSKWTSALALRPQEATGLANYLLMRLQMVTACIQADTNQAKVPRSFYARVETSEKVALSFILGGIGTYLAARRWLGAGGDSVKVFLHAGIYAKGINKAPPLVSFSPASGKSPDYLVESTQGHWHVFESKGGHARGRWARIVEGLLQLDNLPGVAWAGKVPQPATTCVCVHTSVDPGRTLHMTAVDPPSQISTVEGNQPLVLIEGVCKLLLLLEAVEQYRALADGIPEDGVPTVKGWKLATSSQFGGLIVGIPPRYLSHECDVRQRLAVYLAVREVIADPSFEKPKNNARNSLAQLFSERLGSQSLGEGALPVPQRWLQRKLIRIANDFGHEDFLHRCAKHLKLDQVSLRLMPSANQELVVHLTQNLPFALTSGGMFLRQLRQSTPHLEMSVGPSATRG